MKHNLKRKYKWKDRTIHFSHMNMARRWRKKAIETALVGSGFWDDLIRQKDISFTNSVDSHDQLGESALEGNRVRPTPKSFTVPEYEGIKINIPLARDRLKQHIINKIRNPDE